MAPSLLEECIEIATQAPTGMNQESWRFLVLEEREPKLAVANLYRRALASFVEARGVEVRPAQRSLADRQHEMPVLVLVCCEGRMLRPAVRRAPQQVTFWNGWGRLRGPRD